MRRGDRGRIAGDRGQPRHAVHHHDRPARYDVVRCTGWDWAHPVPHLRLDRSRSAVPHLHQDWPQVGLHRRARIRPVRRLAGARPAHICAGTGLTPPTSAPGPGSPRPHLRRDWAHPCPICAGTGLTPPTSAPGPHADWLVPACPAPLHRLSVPLSQSFIIRTHGGLRFPRHMEARPPRSAGCMAWTTALHVPLWRPALPGLGAPRHSGMARHGARRSGQVWAANGNSNSNNSNSNNSNSNSNNSGQVWAANASEIPFVHSLSVGEPEEEYSRIAAVCRLPCTCIVTPCKQRAARHLESHAT
jgi:hypothetical protein